MILAASAVYAAMVVFQFRVENIMESLGSHWEIAVIVDGVEQPQDFVYNWGLIEKLKSKEWLFQIKSLSDRDHYVSWTTRGTLPSSWDLSGSYKYNEADESWTTWGEIASGNPVYAFNVGPNSITWIRFVLRNMAAETGNYGFQLFFEVYERLS